jgi:hypothetical protein
MVEFYKVVSRRLRGKQSEVLDGLRPSTSKVKNNFVEIRKWRSPETKSFWVKIQGHENYVVVDSGVIEDLYNVIQRIKGSIPAKCDRCGSKFFGEVSEHKKKRFVECYCPYCREIFPFDALMIKELKISKGGDKK